MPDTLADTLAKLARAQAAAADPRAATPSVGGGASSRVGVGALPMTVPAPEKILISDSGEPDAFDDIDHFLTQFLEEEHEAPP